MQTTGISTITKNYARALFDTNLDNATIKMELAQVLDTIEESEDLRIVLSNSSISCTKKIGILNDIFYEKISLVSFNLLKILVEKNRISELKNIYEVLCDMDNKSLNKKDVEIVSSIELNEDTKLRIVEKLAGKLKCEILPNWQIDKNIIAGLVFKYDDFVIDTSVLAKLKQLSKQ